MGRGLNKLSARTVQTAKEPGWYGDGGGLYLRVVPAERKGAKGEVAKRWVFVFRWRGKRAEMGLGSVQVLDLPGAREERDTARVHVSKGVDPREARKAAREPQEPTIAPAFSEVAEALIESLKPGWKSAKHGDQWSNTLKTHAAHIWTMPVDAIDTEAVQRVLTPIWSKIPETAGRVRGRIESVLDAATVQGHRTGENPARWKGHLSHVLPARKSLSRGHHPAMPFEDVPAFLKRLRTQPGLAPTALHFTILTAVRTSEALNATWGEFDLGAKLWIIPKERMKGTREHRVLLSDQAVTLLEGIWPPDDGGPTPKTWLFPGFKPGKPLSNMAMEMVLRRMDLDAYTVHGFRSTFSDWAHETTNFASVLVETSLAHISGDKVERAYRRGDALERRRGLMQAWADYADPKPPA